MSPTALSGPIRSIPLLANLGEVQLAKVAGICERRMYRNGDRIVTAGEPADGAYYLIDGHVECVSQICGEPTSTPVPTGATLLELAMIVEVDVTATCTAHGPVKVLKISRSAMHAAMQDDAALTDYFLASLTNRLATTAATMRHAAEPFVDTTKLA